MEGEGQGKRALKQDLSFFDLTSIVVGAIVGSDIYIASSLTAGLVGPLSLVAWIVAGLMAMVLAMILAYSSYLVPRVGGVFAYISEAFDDFFGFLGGWSMWVAEVLSLPVFAITFTNYLGYFIQLGAIEVDAVRGAFIAAVTLVNVLSVKAAGRVNDVLTIAKLSPLLLLVLLGIASFVLVPGGFVTNYTPFAPYGFGNFGAAIVLIFWAYVGFEMGTLPAAEVKDPGTTIPKAIATGMVIVMAFYLLTNFVIFGAAPSSQLKNSMVPLVLVAGHLMAGWGPPLMSAGAMVSVSGSDESGTLGTARLSYAMAIDGLFPRVFAKVHPKFKTPHMALVIQGTMAFGLSLVSSLSDLISFAVFNLAFTFLLASLAFAVLRVRQHRHLRGEGILPWLGVAICGYLLYSTSATNKVLGTAIVLAGIPIYVYLSPKADMHHLKQLFTSEAAVMGRALETQRRFLANFLRLLALAFTRLRAARRSRG